MVITLVLVLVLLDKVIMVVQRFKQTDKTPNMKMEVLRQMKEDMEVLEAVARVLSVVMVLLLVWQVPEVLEVLAQSQVPQ